MLENLKEHETLPVGDEDRIIPTRISKLDIHIKFLNDQLEQINNQIRDTKMDRDLLLKRAKECSITTDSEYKIIEVPIYPKKHVDVETLKRLALEKHEMIVLNLTAKAQDKLKEQMNKIQVSISQADVKNAVITDKGLLAQIIPEPKEPVGYEVSVVKI